MDGRDEKVAEDTRFDRTVRAISSGGSRRAVVRGLAAGLIAAAGGGISMDTLAGKNKKKKRKKAKKQTPAQTPTPTPPPTPTPNPLPEFCPRGTSLGTISVPSDGRVVYTPILPKGQGYILEAYGYWSTGGEYMMDAFAAFRWHDERYPLLYHNGVRLGLAINGESPDLWGPYTQSHRYDFIVIGKDAPVSLQMLDSDFSDNGRDLYVEVLCGAPID